MICFGGESSAWEFFPVMVRQQEVTLLALGASQAEARISSNDTLGLFHKT